MKNFAIYTHPGRNVEAVKQGWSWPAAFFNVAWAFVKKLWLIAVVALVLSGASMLLSHGDFISATASGSSRSVEFTPLEIAFSLAAFAVFGYFGNKWREENLISRGYKKVMTVSARDVTDALLQATQKEETK